MIEVHHLRKEYDDNVALDNLNLDIPSGEVYGLIGPNGAGKTTLIRILATLMEPTYGEVRINGIDALAEQAFVEEAVRGKAFEPFLGEVEGGDPDELAHVALERLEPGLARQFAAQRLQFLVDDILAANRGALLPVSRP